MSVGGLPEGWAWARLGDLGSEVRETVVPSEGNVYELWSVPSFASGSPEVLDGREIGSAKLSVEPGDVLICKINPRINRVWSVTGRNEGLIQVCSPEWVVLRLHSGSTGVSGKYLQYYLSSPSFRQWISSSVSGVTGSHTRAKSKDILARQVPVPPLAEQHRIVEALEEQLSRLDAAEQTLRLACKRIEVLRKSVFTSLVPETAPAGWTVTTVGEAGTLELGRARHPDWHHGPEMRPYLRVANVFEDRIDISSVMEMDFSGIFEKYRLHKGDILLNEGQSPHLVGRPAMYRGVPENVAFTNSLLRFQAGPGVLPEWALMVFRRHLHARRFMREVRITTNIAHLSSKRLKVVEFPIPPLEIQKDLVQRCEELLSGTEAIGREVDRAAQRADALRSALLRKAFNGNLLPQNPTDEPATTFLARIAAERDAAKPARKTKRAARPRKTAAAAKATEAAAPAPTPAPVTTVQQELFQ